MNKRAGLGRAARAWKRSPLLQVMRVRATLATMLMLVALLFAMGSSTVLAEVTGGGSCDREHAVGDAFTNPNGYCDSYTAGWYNTGTLYLDRIVPNACIYKLDCSPSPWNSTATSSWKIPPEFDVPFCPNGTLPRPLSDHACRPIRERDITICLTCGVGNPIYPLTGAKKEYVDTGVRLGGLTLALVYDSTPKLGLATEAIVPGLVQPPAFGELWRSSFHHKLFVNAKSAVVSRGDGILWNFDVSGGSFVPVGSNQNRLVSISGGYVFSETATGQIEVFDSNGTLTQWSAADGTLLTFTYGGDSLLRVRASDGRTVNFTYTGGLITSIVMSDGSTIGAAYNSGGSLTSLTWQDGKIAGFVYENALLPWALTGRVDENSSRFATFAYDGQGRAVSTEHAGGVEKYSVDYLGEPPRREMSIYYDYTDDVFYRTYAITVGDGAAVSMPNGQSTSWQSQLVVGVPRITSQTQSAASGSAAASQATVWDTNGNVASQDGYDGTRTCFSYDGENRQVTRVEGLATSDACSTVLAGTVPTYARKITTAWHPDWRMTSAVTEPLKKTTTVYQGQPDPFNGNAAANCTSAGNRADGKPLPVVCKSVEQALLANGTVDATVATRTTRFTYDSAGRVTSSVDPRGMTTTFAYYSAAAYTSTGSVDGDFVNVALLLHGDGSNGSTTATDSSLTAKSLTSNSGAQISTGQAKFGGASLYFNGSGAYFSGPNSPDLRFGTGDFTVEFFMYLPIDWSSQPYSSGIVGQKNDDYHSGWVLYRDGGRPSKITARVGAGTGAVDLVTTSTPATGTWQHWALTKNAGVCIWWVDGVQDATTSCTANIDDADGGLWIGKSQTWGGALNGYIDELRITSGVARYTANFTPPTASFASQGLDANSVGTSRGDLNSKTDAAGHVTQNVSYDPIGRVRQITDARGVTTDVTYYPRGWVHTATVTPPGGTARMTTYTYDFVGQVTQIAQPDGTTLSFSYDAAHRMTGATDARGNTVTYTLDDSGNRVGEQVRDASSTLQRSITRSFDALNRLQQVTGAAQ